LKINVDNNENNSFLVHMITGRLLASSFPDNT